MGSLEGRAEQLFEGFALLTAAALLTYMVVWMHRQSASIGANLRASVASAVQAGSGLAVFALAFVAVVREGIETALFLFAASRTAAPGETLLGGLAGLGVAVAGGFAPYRGGLRLDLRAFFNASGVLLIFFAAGMLACGVHELEEAALIPAVVSNVWDINWLLNEKEGLGSLLKALFGYNGNPSLGEVTAYLLYLAATLSYYFRLPWPRLGGSRQQPA